ncbi:hypothetical protein ACJJIX_13145 [Microbulbifer sp. VAAC004]|uniref:hypothetical protein n=1 Tax=unclassified Microbulbifer TaxID=2619833 RepID=UPI00403A0C8C
MKQAFKKLISNLLLWGIFIISSVVYYAIRNNLDWNGAIPNSELTKFISYEVVIIQVLSAFILFGGFALFTHKAKSESDTNRGKGFMDIALGEWSSILFNFGSLNLAVGYFIKDGASIIVALVCYGIGLLVYPNPNQAPKNYEIEGHPQIER